MDTRIKIFFACALGIFLGATIALQSTNGSFWWIGIGMVAAGLTGYLTYEFETVPRAIPRAWHAAISWRPNKELLKHRMGVGVAGFHLGLSVALLFFLILIASSFIFRAERSDNIPSFQTIKALFCISALVGISVGLTLAGTTSLQEFKNPWRVSLRSNFIAVFIYWPIRGLIFFIRFAKNLFLLIHSDERLFCGVVATIGSGVGYLYGNALVCAIAGGLIGVLYYELIPKRLLHLVPSKT